MGTFSLISLVRKDHKIKNIVTFHFNFNNKSHPFLFLKYSEYRATIPFLLTKHKRRIHEKPTKNHLCTDCGASFSERTHLNQHTKYIHELITDEKIEEILCFTCGIVIKSKIGLKKHVNNQRQSRKLKF